VTGASEFMGQDDPDTLSTAAAEVREKDGN
jgi:hypothetical protein